MEGKRKPRAERVVVITLDGLIPQYYLDPSWPAPAMQQLYRDGAHARAVRSVFPSHTYPGHTTLVTGALPARHGIGDNRHIEAKADPAWLTEASMIRVPALWDAVRAAGGTTAAIGWPLTVGAPIDWNVPDIWPGSEDQLMAAIRDACTPPDLLDELEREATGRLSIENFSNRHLAHDLRVAAMAAFLLERYRPTLLLAHAQATVQVVQEPSWTNPRRARAIAASDQIVSMVLEVLERTSGWDRTAVIVTGDHGMAEIHSQVRPNIWLIEAGLRGRQLESEPWKARFQSLGGAAFLFVQEPAKENVAAVRRVLETLPSAMQQLFRVLDRDALDALGATSDSSLALVAEPGFVIDDRAEGPVLQPNPGMSHGHHPDMPEMHTGFVAAGAGIRAGASTPLLSLTAIAPLVAELLGLDFDAPDGVVYPGLLSD
jgi:predicted AlkP superfamily pyrophosphatase or phosphodiesterase